jgi:phage shock protein PspC (stress-responsive transcriptional regulator)
MAIKNNFSKIEPKKLYLSRKDKVIAGVCGGYAEYFNIDPVWVRLLAVISVLFGGISIFIYIVSWVLMPKNPGQKTSKNTPAEDIAQKIISKTSNDLKAGREHRSSVIAGMILIVFGMLFFFEKMFGWFRLWFAWPVILVIVGFYLIIRKE